MPGAARSGTELLFVWVPSAQVFRFAATHTLYMPDKGLLGPSDAPTTISLCASQPEPPGKGCWTSAPAPHPPPRHGASFFPPSPLPPVSTSSLHLSDTMTHATRVPVQRTQGCWVMAATQLPSPPPHRTTGHKPTQAPQNQSCGPRMGQTHPLLTTGRQGGRGRPPR